MRISENRLGASQAREVMIQCHHCGKRAYVSFPWDVSPEARQATIRQALMEHRQSVCTATEEMKVVYDILYPRA